MLESDLQHAIFVWASTIVDKYPELKWMYHCPNGEKRDAFTAQRLKQQGVKAGILDLMLCVPRGDYHGLAIELKKPGGKCKSPSLEQLEYIVFLTKQGYYARVSNDFDEVKTIILGYLNSGKEA